MVAIQLSDEMKHAAALVAAQWKIPSDLHVEDHLLRHIAKKWGPKVGVEKYMEGGRNDAAKLRATVEGIKIGKDKLRILDFASGFGRVVRHVDYLMPAHDVFASDIHPAACEFMRERLGIPSFCSSSEPEKLDIGSGYDVIYVMSLFSHLPDKSFGRWIGALYDRLAPGGFLLFTANGMATLDTFPQFYGAVFGKGQSHGYREESDQLDIDSKDYGSMIVSVQYVLDVINHYAPEARLHGYTSARWFAAQDEWIFRRPV